MDNQQYNDVSRPKHYNSHPSGIECIDVTKHFSFCLGNVIKYIWRHKDKGNPIKDLKKAQWYLQKQIEFLEQKEAKNALSSSQTD